MDYKKLLGIFKHRKTVSILIAVAIGLLIWRLWIPSDRIMMKSTALIEHASAYELHIKGKAVLTFDADTTYTPAVWSNRFWLLPSCLGRVVSAPYWRRDSLSHMTSAELSQWIEQKLDLNKAVLKGLKREDAELNYYRRVHGVQDIGYNEIARHAFKIKVGMDTLRYTIAMLQKAAKSDSVTLILNRHYKVIFKTGGRLREEACTWDNQGSEASYMRFRTITKLKPLGVRAISLWPWISNIHEQYYLSHFAKNGYLACKRPHITNFLTIQSDAVDGFLPKDYSGFWVLYEHGCIVYEGMLKRGKREGEGEMTDSKGRHITGFFAADTLYYGERQDSAGTYKGEMNRHGVAMGHGTYLDDASAFYEGKWKNDLRYGFGYSIGPHTYLRAGEWQADVYKGERLVYTSERIYGIDISRFQHEIGKKKYPIDWGKLRILHLGTLSRKQVKGRVNYPISFLYIKTTEGTTIRNAHYKNDYQEAKKHHLRVGSYHFFSTTSAASLQAKYFLQNAQFQRGDLPPVLDLEPYPSQIRKMGGEAVLWARVRTWLSIIEQRTGVKPVLYISQSFVNNYLPYAPDIKKNYPVWIARYGEYKPDVRLVFWQLSPDGKVNGIKGKVDINVFNGYRQEYHQFLKKSTIR
ncbi:MAG: hypothetical protein LKG25_00825 [Prevotella sp.]|jgi:GH25 family lysozyme M1 (1,4-beta-N-acetylmuramidase)|nr:hypothetical protein [Prevotella sp.]MCI1281120.1 hypothetical protein [Prevotella sp.]